jgi:hypothetical protein
VIRNDIRQQPKVTNTTTPCGSCKLCPSISSDSTVTNTRKKISVEATSGGTCRSKCVIYVARCKKCDLLYIGHTKNEIRERFSNRPYYIKERPTNTNNFLSTSEKITVKMTSKLEFYNLECGMTKNANFTKTSGFAVCRPDGINRSTKQYAKDMYASYASNH